MKKTLVLGLGKSGIAAAQLLLSQKKQVLGFDDKIKQRDDLEIAKDFESIQWEEINSLIVSPGVPPTHPVYREASKRNIEIMGEIAFALQFLKSQPIIAITGTNGKTTVTLLVEHALRGAGLKAKALGNVGEPLSSYVLARDVEDIIVLELSSYQIETLREKTFDAAVILNITPDHLDRHLNMQGYAKAKCDLQLYLKDNAPFYVQSKVAQEYGDLLQRPFLTYSAEDISKENALAAWSLCQSFGVSAEQFRKSLESFKKPAHRIEFVCEIDGICYYDDSKGTNVDAVIHAVNAMRGPVILIAGGVDKGASYLSWTTSFKQQVRLMIVLGQAAPNISKELNPFFTIECVETLAAAVDLARDKAKEGDFVLLSPGCASYDMFRDYAHRGQEFQRYVHDLKRRVLS